MKTYFVKVSYFNVDLGRRVHENIEGVRLLPNKSVSDSVYWQLQTCDTVEDFTVDFIAPMSMFEDSE